MKTLLNRTALALLLTATANLALAQTTPQVIDIPLSRPGETANVEIEFFFGSDGVCPRTR